MLTRRQLFKTGLVGGVAVLAAGWRLLPPILRHRLYHRLAGDS
ncbi:hypothetical protein [Paludibacterium denitrificans]|nr:hypothetical protein [Paludibacterium denitrificans]